MLEVLSVTVGDLLIVAVSVVIALLLLRIVGIIRGGRRG